MVSEDLESMEKYISRFSGGYLMIVALSIFISWKYNDILSLVEEMSEFDFSGITIATFLTVAASAVGFVLIHFQTYVAIDNILFGARRSTDEYICDYLRREVEITLGRKTSATKKELMGLFYSFVNLKNEVWSTLWSLSFGKWKHYWTSMNLIGISIVGVVVEAVLMMFGDPHASLAIVVVVLLLVFLLFLVLNSQCGIRPKLVGDIAEEQLVMMTKDFRTEFDAKVRSRFGG